MSLLTLAVLILLIAALVLFIIAAKPWPNLIATGLACLTLAAIIYLFVR